MKLLVFKLLLIFACLYASISCDKFLSKKVAVLLAGSNNYYNYRHQADIAHAYLNLRRHDFNDENIIVMMYDDIAREPANVAYNTLFNRPYSENVYKKLHIDYSHDDVTTDVFAAVLGGYTNLLRDKGNGKFVDVTEHDTVFIYMADHGATGLFGFPGGYDNLYADDFIKSLKQLKSRCKQVVVFMEACESGSMFEGYLDDVEGILAVTAANPDESSYAFYYAEYVNNYLGDEFSINFLEYMEKANPLETTIKDLVNVVTTETKESHVQVYGDRSLLKLKIADIFGNKQEYNAVQVPTSQEQEDLWAKFGNDFKVPIAMETKQVQKTIAKEKLKKNPKDRESLKLIKTERKIERLFKSIQESFPQVFESNSESQTTRAKRTGPVFAKQHVKSCYADSINYFNQKCYSANQYNVIYSYYNVLYRLCSAGDVTTRDVLNSINSVCPTY